MEKQERRNEAKTGARANLRRSAKALAVAVLGCVAGLAYPQDVTGAPAGYDRHTREHFRSDMPFTVKADHPAIRPVADAIRAVTRDPLEQIVMVNDITHLLVDYDEDERVYGAPEFHATFEEMLARRRAGGWLYLRDDCDGRAVFAAHLLANLGIAWRLEASFWKEHAWIVARVNGVDYDLLDLRRNAPETARLTYRLLGRHFVRPTQRPPAFGWRKAWADRTERNFKIGMTLGLLTLDSTPAQQHARYATDWTQRAPRDKASPYDARVLTAKVAGFPYGEALEVGAIAGNLPKPSSNGLTLGVTTSSP